MTLEIPYPPVFRDWLHRENRVATVACNIGVGIEMFQPENNTWRLVVLTEEDAIRLAASLLDHAGETKLAKKVLKGG